MASAEVLKETNKSKTPKAKGSPSKMKTKNVNDSVKVKKLKKKRPSLRKLREEKRGVVYLSHIPHGFYEDQIEAYFKQFGKVTAVSVPRSKTGRMRGFAFIEFQHPEVAEIAAETMNNYLMFNRVIKAKYIPPSKQKPRLFLLAQIARATHRTAPEKAALKVKHSRMLKNRMLKTNLEARVMAKLLRKQKALEAHIGKLGLDYEFQVQKGDIQSIFKRKKELKEKKKKSKQDSVSKMEEAPSENSENPSPLKGNKVLSSIKGMDVETKNGKEIDKEIITPKLNKPSKTSQGQKKAKVVKQTSSPLKLNKKKRSRPKKRQVIKNVEETSSLKLPNIKEKSKETTLKTLTQKKYNSLKRLQKKYSTLLSPSKLKEIMENAQIKATPLALKSTDQKENQLKSPKHKIKFAKHQSTQQNIKVPIVKTQMKKQKPTKVENLPYSPKSHKLKNRVMVVDENDHEISFSTPPNVTKKFINSKKKTVEKPPKENKHVSLKMSKKTDPMKSSPHKKQRHRVLKKISQLQ